MSIVSSATRLRASGDMYCSVRMLCRRSASLTSSTRTSSAIASSSLRRFSACLASRETRSSFFSLVRPSTRWPMSLPNSWSISAVGELDQQHPHVLGDREQQLAQVLGLLGLARNEIELLQLGEALDQMADVLAEQLVDLGACGFGVLDGVVQQRRDDRRFVELEIGEDRGDLERMGEIRVAGGAHLLAVRLHGVHIGAVEQLLVGVRVVLADALDQLVLAHHRRLGACERLRGPRPAAAAREPPR